MTLNAELKEVATMASVALALLGLFTNVRAQRYSQELAGGIGALNKRAVLQLLLDCGLAVITFGACAAMWPLFSRAVSLSHWADGQHALRSLFAVMYLGFALLLVYQLSLAFRRAGPLLSNVITLARNPKK